MTEVEKELRGLRELVVKIAEKMEGIGLPQLMKLSRAAKELSISETKLRELIRLGELGVVRIGDRNMVPAREIHRLSQVGTSGSKPGTPTGSKSRKPRKGEDGLTPAQRILAAIKADR